VVDLLEVVPMLQEVRREIAIIGKENEAGGGVFEIADGIDAFGKAAEEIAKSFAAFGIGQAGDDFGRLVEGEINSAFFFGGYFFAGDFDYVGAGVGLGAEFADGLTVHADLTA
jgi:hypothetical protein